MIGGGGCQDSLNTNASKRESASGITAVAARVVSIARRSARIQSRCAGRRSAPAAIQSTGASIGIERPNASTAEFAATAADDITPIVLEVVGAVETVGFREWRHEDR